MNVKTFTQLLFLSLFLLAGTLEAQQLSRSHARRHRQEIQRSTACGCLIESYDTTYYRGRAEHVLDYIQRGYYRVYDLHGNHVLDVTKFWQNYQDGTREFFVRYSIPEVPEAQGFASHLFVEGRISMTVINYKIIENGRFNAKNWQKFINTNQLAPPVISQNQAPTEKSTRQNDFSPAPNTTPAEKSAEITVSNGNIFRGNVMVAGIETTSEIQKDILTSVHTIVCSGNQACAKIAYPQNVQGVTTVTILSSGEEFTTDSRDLGEIARALAKRSVF